MPKPISNNPIHMARHNLLAIILFLHLGFMICLRVLKRFPLYARVASYPSLRYDPNMLCRLALFRVRMYVAMGFDVRRFYVF
jgi:hypothetical protein